MALMTTTTPAEVAVALGKEAPDPGAPLYEQWQMWISDALMLVQARVDELGADEGSIDQIKLDYVIREAVKSHAQRPDDATQVTRAVDDASATRIYRSSKGRVDILDEWWTLLGLAPDGGQAYAVDTSPRRGASGHMPWCDPAFGGLDCSCGAILTRHEYPLYEGGVLSPSPDWWAW